MPHFRLILESFVNLRRLAQEFSLKGRKNFKKHSQKTMFVMPKLGIAANCVGLGNKSPGPQQN